MRMTLRQKIALAATAVILAAVLAATILTVTRRDAAWEAWETRGTGLILNKDGELRELYDIDRITAIHGAGDENPGYTRYPLSDLIVAIPEYFPHMPSRGDSVTFGGKGMTVDTTIREGGLTYIYGDSPKDLIYKGDE